MTTTERTVWASAIAVVVSSGAYLTLMASRALAGPVAAISWVRPMLWTMGLSIAGGVVLSIVLAIVAGIVRPAGSGPAADCAGVAADIRDREIGRRGGGVSMRVLSAGFGGALVLAMLDADTFWIGNLLFLFGTAAALVEAATKLILYRRGF